MPTEIYEQIRDEIVSGELEAGTLLVETALTPAAAPAELPSGRPSAASSRMG